MAKIGEYLDKFNEFEIANIPVGAGVWYKSAEQVAKFVTDVISHVLPMVPPIVSGGVAAWLLRHPKVQDFLGKYGSYYASMAAAGNAIDEQIGFSTMVENLLSKVKGKLPSLPASTGGSSEKQVTGVENLGQLPSPEGGEIDADIYEAFMKQGRIEGVE
ncbi:MAG: hypothetical protein DRG27_01000 [Deltaproteobacteria bacterium]|nr:MAG: hypothetical protein DRG27_01000 [Deltaproteobacteria bacterium]